MRDGELTCCIRIRSTKKYHVNQMGKIGMLSNPLVKEMTFFCKDIKNVRTFSLKMN